MKPKGRPPGTPKTGGRIKGSRGRRLFVTIPKQQAAHFQNYTDTELRKLIALLLQEEAAAIRSEKRAST